MIEYGLSELFEKDSVKKSITISYDGGTITNEDLYSENFSLQESICSDTTLKFGLCESSCLRFRYADNGSDLVGKNLNVSMVLDNNDNEPFKLGDYKVDTSILTANRLYRDVTAYDKMFEIINTNIMNWYDSYFSDASVTHTLKETRTALMNYLNVPQREVNLVNDSLIVTRTIDTTDVLSAKDFLNQLLELNGCFGHIDRDGYFDYITLDTGIDLTYKNDDLDYQGKTLYYIKPNDDVQKSSYLTCEYAEYDFNLITGLALRESQNDVGILYGDTHTNAYIIEDNMFLYGLNTDELNQVAANLLPLIQGITYTPLSLKKRGNPCIEVGDYISIHVNDNRIIRAYILDRTLNGIQSLKDSIVADGQEKYLEQVNSSNSEIIAVKRLYSQIEKQVGMLSTKVGEVDSYSRRLSDDFTRDKQGIYDAMTGLVSTSELESFIKQEVENILLEVSKRNTFINTEEDTLVEYETDEAPTEGSLAVRVTSYLYTFPCHFYDENGVLHTWWRYTKAGQNKVGTFRVGYTDMMASHEGEVLYCKANGQHYQFNYNNGDCFWQKLTEEQYVDISNSITSLSIGKGKIDIQTKVNDNYSQIYIDRNDINFSVCVDGVLKSISILDIIDRLGT